MSTDERAEDSCLECGEPWVNDRFGNCRECGAVPCGSGYGDMSVYDRADLLRKQRKGE